MRHRGIASVQKHHQEHQTEGKAASEEIGRGAALLAAARKCCAGLSGVWKRFKEGWRPPFFCKTFTRLSLQQTALEDRECIRPPDPKGSRPKSLLKDLCSPSFKFLSCDTAAVSARPSHRPFTKKDGTQPSWAASWEASLKAVPPAASRQGAPRTTDSRLHPGAPRAPPRPCILRGSQALTCASAQKHCRAPQRHS